MRKLYEIDKDIDSFEWIIDPDTGEILNPDGLDELQMERDAKIEGVSLKIKNLTAELDAVKREKANFDSRAKSLEKEIEGVQRVSDIRTTGAEVQHAESGCQLP